MARSPWVILPVMLPVALAAACTPEEERAAEACRFEVRRRLVMPSTANFRDVRVAPRASATGDWRVDLVVSAANQAGETSSSSVSCTLDPELVLLDLSGE